MHLNVKKVKGNLERMMHVIFRDKVVVFKQEEHT